MGNDMLADLPATSLSPPPKFSMIRPHIGQSLIKNAGAYATIREIIQELVQNGLDANATKIWIIIDYVRRVLTVRDNGDGVTCTEFELALRSVCTSIKSEEKLGRFGLGLISPLGKCERFRFTSCKYPEESLFQEWTFDSKEIANSYDFPQVPLVMRHDLTLDPRGAKKGKEVVTWRTEVVMERFTEDKVINKITLDGLVNALLERFGTAMRRHNTKLTVRLIDEQGVEQSRERIRASCFTGQRLPEVVLEERDGGKTVLKLYLTRPEAGRRRGRVLVGEMDNDFRIPFSTLMRSAGNLIEPATADALNSGLFEGEILSERISLHVDRARFNKNEAFLGMCVSVNEWFETVGKKHLEAARDSREDERYQELGLKTMSRLEELLRGGKFPDLKKLFQSFRSGNIGRGQVETRPNCGRLNEDKTPKPKPENPDPTKPRVEREKQVSLSVTGPKGQVRRAVKSSSLGFQFSHEKMEGNDRLWLFERETVTLRFNIRHPLWVCCSGRDHQVLKLQEFIAIQALTLEITPDDWQEQNRLALDEMTSFFVHLLISGDKTRPPKESGKKKK